ncbi:hypothetical protein ACFL6X_04725 [Candidatus Latescibacterota bacterium]
MQARNDEFISNLDPDIFSHGRVLRRFPRSDACRFSARTALNLLERVATRGDSGDPQVLWDPFCGIGMIPCVALAAFPGKFDVVVASDINGEACSCARRNMQIVTDVGAFEARLGEINRSRRMNRGMDKRSGIVERYMKRIQPMLLGSSCPSRFAAVKSDAFFLPAAVNGDLHLVSDLPHGKESLLHGGHLRELLPSLREAYPRASISLVTTSDAVGELCASSVVADCWSLAGGRVVVQARA